METVLITGAARRVGSLIAENLAENGCFVWVHYRTHEQDARELVKRIREKGGQADCVYADLESPADIDKMLSIITDSANGNLTTVIHNASIFLKGRLTTTSVADWDRVMNVNLRAVWYLSSRFYEHFPTAKRIITIGDASVVSAYSEHAAYGLSKYALKYLNEQMAVAFAPDIRVNLISPGMVLQGDGEPEAVWNRRNSRTLTDNQKSVESIQQAIRFLMSDPGMTGSELVADNGLQLYCKNQRIE